MAAIDDIPEPLADDTAPRRPINGLKKRRIRASDKTALAPAPRPSLSPAVVEAWKRAQNVTEQDVSAYVPQMADISVGEALLAGRLSLDDIVAYSGENRAVVQQTLATPVAMAWISRQIYGHFIHRAALVDAALIQRALSGDVSAIRLFYERSGKLVDTKHVQHTVQGGLNLTALTLEDLAKLVEDKQRTLPELSSQKVIDAPAEQK